MTIDLESPLEEIGSAMFCELSGIPSVPSILAALEVDAGAVPSTFAALDDNSGAVPSIFAALRLIPLSS
jgi:hypothetical protein